MTSCSGASEDTVSGAGAKPRGRWIPAAALVVLVAFFFAPGLFFGRVPVFRDLLVLVIPMRIFARDAIRNGEIPLWNPNLFFGSPFLANYQSAVLYPPSALLYGVPFPESLSLFLASHLLIAGIGMKLFLERELQMMPVQAMFGAVVFVFGGFLVSLIPLTNHLEVASWIPWILLAASRLSSRWRWRRFAFLTLLFALQLLAGAPEAVLLTLVLLGADGGRRARRDGTSWRGAAWSCAAFSLAMGLCAAQLLPTAEYAFETDRASGLPFSAVATESLRFRSFLQLIFPHTFSAGAADFVPEGRIPLVWSLYVGIVPLALGAAGLIGRASFVWSVMLVLGVVLSLGDSTPLLSTLYDIAPRMIGSFRYPAKFFLLAHFALAVLAAHGLGRLVRERAVRRVTAVLLAAIAGVTLIVAILGSVAPRTVLQAMGYATSGLPGAACELLFATVRSTAVRGGALSLAALGALWLWHADAIATRWFTGLIVLITAVDLLAIHHPMLVFTDWQTLNESVDLHRLGIANGERIFHYCTGPGCSSDGGSAIGPWTATLRPLESVEVKARSVWAALVPDAPFVYGLGAVAGFDGWSLRAKESFYRTLASVPRDQGVHLLSALAVDRLIGAKPLDDPGLRLVSHRDAADDMEFWQYQVVAPAPRMYLAERVLFAPEAESALTRVARPDFRAGRDAVLPGSMEAPPQKVGAGEIEARLVTSTLVRARVSLADAGVLVVSDTWYPGWAAIVDGKPVEITHTNGVVRGVRVPAGRHLVEMRYRPFSFRLGVGVSLTAVALLGVASCAAILRRGFGP